MPSLDATCSRCGQWLGGRPDRSPVRCPVCRHRGVPLDLGPHAVMLREVLAERSVICPGPCGEPLGGVESAACPRCARDLRLLVPLDPAREARVWAELLSRAEVGCRGCGYPLRSAVRPTCPECGRRHRLSDVTSVIDWRAPRTEAEVARVQWGAAVFPLVIALAVHLPLLLVRAPGVRPAGGAVGAIDRSTLVAVDVALLVALLVLRPLMLALPGAGRRSVAVLVWAWAAASIVAAFVLP
jgi:hypothetical protein